MENKEDIKSACLELLGKKLDEIKIKSDNDSKLNCTQVELETASSSSKKNDEDLNSLRFTTSSSTENIIKPQKEAGHQKKINKPKDTLLKNMSGVSDSELTKKSNSGLAKILQWDPWHKIKRNKKKDKAPRLNMQNKQHKKNDLQNKNVTPDFVDKSEGANLGLFDLKPVDEIQPQNPMTETENTSMLCNQEYSDLGDKPKVSKKQKSVRFQSEVTVVLFGNDQILGETIEPLKKEQEQQARNKELRKEVCPEGYRPTNWKKANDYMGSWYIRRK